MTWQGFLHLKRTVQIATIAPCNSCNVYNVYKYNVQCVQVFVCLKYVTMWSTLCCDSCRLVGLAQSDDIVDSTWLEDDEAEVADGEVDQGEVHIKGTVTTTWDEKVC